MRRHLALGILLLCISFSIGAKAPRKKPQSQRFHPYKTNPSAPTRKELRPGVNSDGAKNNCLYCTIAGVKGSTVDKVLKNKNGGPMYMDSKYIQGPPDFKRISQQSGFPNTKVKTFPTEGGVGSFLKKNLRPGQSKTFGLAYPHKNQPGGHVVAMKAWKKQGKVGTKIIDYQRPPGGRFKTRPDGKEYHVIDFGKKKFR